MISPSDRELFLEHFFKRRQRGVSEEMPPIKQTNHETIGSSAVVNFPGQLADSDVVPGTALTQRTRLDIALLRFPTRYQCKCSCSNLAMWHQLTLQFIGQ